MEVEKEKIINKERIFCEKCRSMLLFNLYIDNKTIYIKINCKCYKNKVFVFDDYLQSLHNKKSQEPFCDINIEHSNNPSIYFCKECNKHYCNLCMNNHSFFLPLHKISEININLPYLPTDYHGSYIEIYINTNKYMDGITICSGKLKYYLYQKNGKYNVKEIEKEFNSESITAEYQLDSENKTLIVTVTPTESTGVGSALYVIM